jgi:hypothetical protein
MLLKRAARQGQVMACRSRRQTDSQDDIRENGAINYREERCVREREEKNDFFPLENGCCKQTVFAKAFLKLDFVEKKTGIPQSEK